MRNEKGTESINPYLMSDKLPNFAWRFAGQADGPHVVVFGGVHGNERTGVLVVERLRDDLASGALTLASGTLTLALGNPRAIELDARGSEPHADLNRVFDDARLSDPTDQSYEVVRARELAALIREADVFVDLHATNKPSDPFVLAISDTPDRRELCSFFHCDKLLIVPNEVIGGTSDGYADLHGARGITFESGWVGDLSKVDDMRVSLEAVFSRVGLLEPRAAATYPQVPYLMTEAVVLREDGFAFASGRGERNFEPFVRGDVIGHAGETPVLAPYDGVLLFPKVPELWKVGSPVCFFARSL